MLPETKDIPWPKDQIDEWVLAELRDPAYENNLHYSKATYARGCRGPLCRAKEADASRKRYQAQCRREGKAYSPRIVEWDLAREAFLRKIAEWHVTWLKNMREISRQEKARARHLALAEHHRAAGQEAADKLKADHEAWAQGHLAKAQQLAAAVEAVQTSLAG